MTWGDVENFYTGLLTMMEGITLDTGMITPEWDVFLTDALDRLLPTRYIYDDAGHRYELRGFEVLQDAGDGAHSCGKLCDFKRTADKMSLIYKNGDYIEGHGERVSSDLTQFKAV